MLKCPIATFAQVIERRRVDPSSSMSLRVKTVNSQTARAEGPQAAVVTPSIKINLFGSLLSEDDIKRHRYHLKDGEFPVSFTRAAQ